jgi:hypothetical protein
MHRFRNIVALLIVVASGIKLCCQEKKSTTFHGTLPEALLFVDQTFHTAVLGELVDPVPSNISILLGPESSARAALSAIIAQCPGYVMVRDGEVYIVAQKQLLHDSANPMNQLMRSYRIPGDLTELKLGFPNAVSAAAQGDSVSEGGALLSGLALPKSLSPQLRIEQLHNVTAREVLIHVAGEVGNLYSVLILPSSHPAKETREHRGFLGWEIAGGTGLAKYTARLKYYPRTQAAN